MKHLSCGVLLLCATVGAQSGFATSPPGFDQREGGSSSTFLGGYPDARFQVFDGELKNNTARTLKGVAMRHDSRAYTTGEGMGRSWTALTVEIAHADFTQLTATFGSNPTSASVRVFSAAVTWPTASGFPATRPAFWGTPSGALRFPFSQPWAYTGKSEVLLDFDFTGGTLANNTAWPNTRLVPYYLDGYSDAPYEGGAVTAYGAGGAASGCVDTSNPANRGGDVEIHSVTYNDTYHVASLAGRHALALRSYYTAPGRPVTHVLSLRGNTNGIALPFVACNRAYIDLTQPAVFLPRIAGNAPDAPAETDLGTVPYTPAAVGLPIFFQAVWAAGGAGPLMLTRGASTTLVEKPINPRRFLLYQNDPLTKAQTGIGPLDYDYLNPMLRWEF